MHGVGNATQLLAWPEKNSKTVGGRVRRPVTPLRLTEDAIERARKQNFRLLDQDKRLPARQKLIWSIRKCIDSEAR